MRSVETDWYTTTFDTLYPLLYAHRSVEAARDEVAFAMKHLQLEQCGTLFDLCCGGGRHLKHLSAHCSRLVGLDYSSDLLRIAREHLPAHVQLVRGDMRRLPFAAGFDAVVNFFTSFGYFPTDAENLDVLRQMSAVLRPKGRFFMDYLNPDHVRNSVVPHSERDLDGRHVVEDRWLDEALGRINKRTRIYRDDALESETGESVRLYSLEEMRCAFASHGLEIEQVFGDYTGAAYSPELPRMILCGGKA